MSSTQDPRQASPKPSKSKSGAASSGAPSSVLPSGVRIVNDSQVITGDKLHELLAQISATETLDPQAEELLIDFGEDFIESVVNFSCELAKNRQGDTLEVRDIQLHLERNWNIRLPGFTGPEELRQPVTFIRTGSNENHKHRLNAKRRKLNSDA